MTIPTNAVRFNAAGYGTADFVVASAVTNYQTPEQANVVDGKLYRYYAQSLDGTQWEAGFGAYTVSTHTLARTTIQGTSNGDTNVVNFLLAPIVDVYGSPSGKLEPYGQPLTIVGGIDLNTIVNPGTYFCTDATAINGPIIGGQWYIEVIATSGPLYLMQRATNLTGAYATIFTRTLVNNTWQPWHSFINVLKGHLFGLILSAAGATATFGVAAGEAADSAGVDLMVLASAYTKTTGAWAIGPAAGSLDTGAIAASTSYHTFLIKRPDTGAVDVLTSLSATAPTMPTSYTLFRRIGSMKTDGSSQWVKFIQDGDNFTWDTPVQDVAATNPGTAAVTRTLSVPTGIRVEATVGAYVDANPGSASSGAIYISDLSGADVAASQFAFTAMQYDGSSAGEVASGSWMRVFTNTSGQVRSRVAISAATTGLFMVTLGWRDRRGKDA